MGYISKKRASLLLCNNICGIDGATHNSSKFQNHIWNSINNDYSTGLRKSIPKWKNYSNHQKGFRGKPKWDNTYGGRFGVANPPTLVEINQYGLLGGAVGQPLRNF